jgi:hypothetical protein
MIVDWKVRKLLRRPDAAAPAGTSAADDDQDMHTLAT